MRCCYAYLVSCPPWVVKPSGCMPTSRCQWSQALGIEIVDSVAPTHPHALFRISPDAHVRQCVRPLCSTRRLRVTPTRILTREGTQRRYVAEERTPPLSIGVHQTCI